MGPMKPLCSGLLVRAVMGFLTCVLLDLHLPDSDSEYPQNSSGALCIAQELLCRYSRVLTGVKNRSQPWKIFILQSVW